MIDPTIPLGFHPTTEAPNLPNMFLQGQQLAIQRQAAAQESQLRAQQIQAATRANQAADLEQQDQAKLRQVYTQSGGDPDKTVQGAIAAGVSPKNVQALQQHFADYAEKVAKTHSDELATNKYRDDQMLGLIDQADKLAQGDPNQYAQAWPQLYAAAVKLDPSAAQHLSPMAPPSTDQLSMARTGYATHQYFVDQENRKREQQQADAATANAASNTARTNAELKGLQADSDAKVLAAKMMARVQEHPETLDAQIDSEIDPKKYPAINQSAKTAARAATNYPDMQKAIAAGLSDVRSQERAVETAKLEAGTRINEATTIARTNSEMQARQRAVDEVAKSEASYNQFASSAQNLKDVLTQAVNGNAEAAQQFRAMLPQFVMSANSIGTKRLAPGATEQQPGGAADKLQAIVNGVINGTKISDREKADAPGFIDQMVSGARDSHNAFVRTYKKNYKIDADEVQAPKAAAKMFPAAQVHAYAAAHGITDDAAKQAITGAGYKIQ